MERAVKKTPLLFLLFSCVFFSCARPEVYPEPASLSPLETVRRLAGENDSISGFIPDDESSALYPAELQSIYNQGFIVFAMTSTELKPFYYTQNGELIGVDVELGYAIANRLGVRAVFNREAASADDAVQNVINKEADIVLCALNRTIQRAGLVRYTNPYLVYRYGLLINRREFAKTETENMLADYVRHFRGKLGIVGNTPYTEYARMYFPGAGIEMFDTLDAAVDALTDGRLLALYHDEGTVLEIFTTRENVSLILKPVIISDKQEFIVMAAAPDAPQLQEWLNLFLEEYLGQNPHTISRIVDRHYMVR